MEGTTAATPTVAVCRGQCFRATNRKGGTLASITADHGIADPRRRVEASDGSRHGRRHTTQSGRLILAWKGEAANVWPGFANAIWRSAAGLGRMLPPPC